ncbi:ParA family protein [Solibaculum intestinale]|uniref:ParA family protein n=1 Tax=Solibaculum intestinale TaxID=3133165 RepID=A0ABV1DZS5_9FIRM
MCKVICTATCKGGDGKTTSTVNISAYISKRKKVCVVDLDPQHSLTTHFGVRQSELKACKTIYDIFFYLIDHDDIDDEELSELVHSCVIHTSEVDLIPSTTKLARLVKLLPSATNCEHLLEYALSFIKEEYEYIFLDSHSGFDLFCHNALACADSVLIPVEANIFGCEGLGEVLPIINGLKKRMNPHLSIEGILFTKYRARTKNNQSFRELVYRDFGNIHIFAPIIPERTSVSEAPSFGMSIHEYAPNSDAAAAYAEVAEEVMSHA